MSPNSESTGLLTSREVMRLISAIFLIGIIGLMYVQAKKTASWQSIATASETEEAPAVRPGPWSERVFRPEEYSDSQDPLHTDTEEIGALKEELQAVTDASEVAKEEMAAYWRLMRWAYAIPGTELRKQARADVTFSHLQRHPDQYRGALIELKLYARRVAVEKAPLNSAGADRIWQVSGPTEDSGVYPYILILSDLPPEIPEKTNIDVRVRFVGFFLKQLAYPDSGGDTRQAPLLIGRLIVDPTLSPAPVDANSGLTVPWIVGIVLGLTTLVGLASLWSRTERSRNRPPTHDEATIDSFLDRLESEAPPPNPPDRQPPD